MNKKNTIMNIIIIIFMILSYLSLDIGLRYITYESYKFYHYKNIIPILFSLSWISLFIGIFYLIKPKKRKVFYIITLIISNILCLSQYLHFKTLDRFFGISDLFLISEGSKYFNHALMNIDFKILIVILISLTLSFIPIILSKKYYEQTRDKVYFYFSIMLTIICFIGLSVSARLNMGKEAKNSYDVSLSVKSTYKEFNNPSKNIQISGMYESIFRGTYIHVRDKLNNNPKEIEEEINTYIENNNKVLTSNKYTGLFKDKNLIIIMAESLDNFLINNKVMPTLYKLSNEGLNFTNRYSPSFGGGQTINSEFALNTGLYTSLEENIFNSSNTYKTSLPNIFKSNGYNVNSIHFNHGVFYNRSEFHKNLGYNNHYALSDMEDIDKHIYNYEFDSNLILSEKVSNLIIPDNKFLTFITTYSTHLPYDSTNNRCNTDNELSCINYLANDTDKMIKLLIDKLKEKNILDDTILVIVTDHYMYGYSNIESIKNTNNSYLLQHTPFIIWSNNIEHKDINIPVDTADILPTILNLFNIEYNPNLYVGEDIFSKDRNNYIYFSEDTYYKDNKLYDINNSNIDKEILKKIKETIKFNNNLIKNNYLRTNKD